MCGLLWARRSQKVCQGFKAMLLLEGLCLLVLAVFCIKINLVRSVIHFDSCGYVWYCLSFINFALS